MPHKIHIGGRTISAVPWRSKGHATGVGCGALLGNPGGGGEGSVYNGVNEYEKMTGRTVGIGSGLSAKLSGLIVKPINRKPKNIKFEM